MLPLRMCQRVFLIIFIISGFVILLKLWYLPVYENMSTMPAKAMWNNFVTRKGNEKKIKKQNSMEFYQPPKFSQFSSCPACFGYKMCQEMDMRTLIFHGELHATYNNKILWKKAVLKEERVLISSPSQDEWNKFDEFMCLNSSQTFPCDISSAIRRTYLGGDEIMFIEKVQNLYQLLDVSHKVALPVCASKHLMEELKKTFDDDFDGYLSKEEQLMLFTSLLMHPGYVVMKLQSKSGMNMPIPNLMGACGRSVALDGGLTPLTEFLTESFDLRAGLAVQVLQIVEDFEDEDPRWYFMYTDFSLESLVLTKDGEVIVMDLTDLVILDKSTFPPGYSKMKQSDELCNIMCFQKVTQDLLYSSNTSVCTQVSQYSQLMYAIICKQVLSDLKEHKTEGFFNFDGHRVHKESKYLGLLHSIPTDKEHMEDLLRECVQETKPNGRMKAVEELRNILENHINPSETIENSYPKVVSVSSMSVKHHYNNYANEEEGEGYDDSETV